MKRTRENLIGKRFNRLTVINQADDLVNSSGNRKIQWLCKCDCGNEVIVRGDLLKNGAIKSCGCYKKDILIEFNKNNKKTNKYILFDDYGVLWTSNTNEEVYFDIDDADEILKYCWHKENSGYPATTIDDKKVRLHTFLGFKWHDHSNRNKLDNRKKNFRPCDYSQNGTNKGLRNDNTSGVIGVYWFSRDKKWRAQININGKMKSLGNFVNKEDAIKARLIAESKYYKEFAPQYHLFEEYGVKHEEN